MTIQNAQAKDRQQGGNGTAEAAGGGGGRPDSGDAAADAERMQKEGVILKQNPLLINKIVAERLSDKLQIMMVPADGKFFFANDVLRSMNVNNQAVQAEEPAEQPSK